MTLQTNRVLERLVLEHEHFEQRELSFDLDDGSRLVFYIRTVTPEERAEIDKDTGRLFPAPPIMYSDTPSGRFAKYDLTNKDYVLRVRLWQNTVGLRFLSVALGLTDIEAAWVERNFPYNWFNDLKSVVELINGVHSEPLSDLLEDAIWSNEVAGWISTYRSPPDACHISDTSLFREMECIVAAGLDLRIWKSFTPRERLLYLEWHTYKQAREGYQSWWTFEKGKEQTDTRRRRS